MAYSAIIGGTEQIPLASTQGWADAKSWIDELDAETFPLIVHLAEHGWTQDLPGVRKQIIAALKAQPPDDESIAKTMAGLALALKSAKGESLFVSDGTAVDDGGDDDGWESSGDDPEPTARERLLALGVDLPRVKRINNDRVAGKAPAVPDFHRLGDIAMATINVILARLVDALERMQPVGEILAEVDRLVTQVEFASRIAGAVGLWYETGEQLYTLDLPPELDFDPKPRKRFPWLEEAATWLIDKGVYGDREIDVIAAEASTKASQRWKSVKALETLRAEVVAGLVTGESFQSFNARVKDLVTATKPQLETAFRTATHQAYVVGQTATLEKPLIKTLFPAVIFHATHDTRVRDSHLALDRRVFSVGSDAYVIAKRALNDFNCVLPGTSVEGHFLAGTRSFYRGQAIKIETVSGSIIRVTSQHPVLTENGWVNAGSLKQGDKLFHHESHRKVPSESLPSLELNVGTSQVNHGPTPIEQVFGALSALGFVEVCPRKASDFHGDGKSIDSDVDVVWSDERLLADTKPATPESVGDIVLKPALQSVVCSEHLMRSLILRHSRPLQALGFGATSNLDAALFEAANQAGATNAATVGDALDGVAGQILGNQSVDVRNVGDVTTNRDSSLNQAVANSLLVSADHVRNLLHRKPAPVSLDEIVTLSVSEYSGHVYDLQSVSGLIVAHGLLISNCRCVAVPLQRSKLKSKPAPQEIGDLPAAVLADYA